MLIHVEVLSDAQRIFHVQTIDPHIIVMSLKRHSIDFLDKVMKLLLISVCFYPQSAHKYHFIILKNESCMYLGNVF